MHGRGHAWQGVCMAGGMCSRGACMAGGHVWWGTMHGRGCAWQGGMFLQGACMAGGVWQGDMHGEAGGVRGIQSMSGRYASYWNAFSLRICNWMIV